MLTVSILLFKQAACKGVYPSVSHRFTLLLHFSKMLTTSLWPFLQAKCKGVYPLMSHRFTTNGYTPLHVACIHGHIDIVNILLKCNSSVNLCDTDGYTPLHEEYIHQCHIDSHYYYTSVRC
jgi:hypothetical protein